MKYIAFYLPQYHPVKENNEWWGNGFTEWTNVSKARPQFSGHYQPQIPSDLGFYDLRLPESREAQASLAKEYGIDAFCYYHYWFNGKLLLEKPFDEVLKSRNPDFPFCLCWANENWTRRWDGMEQEVLIKQDYENYNPEEHIDWLIEAFLDKRYIKIHNKPLFLIYRANDIPDLGNVIKRWRLRIKYHGFEDMYIVAANNSQNTYTYEELVDFGFDAIYDFEPNLRGMSNLVSIADSPGLNIYNYPQLVNEKISIDYPNDITVFPCVFPSWDNSPRRKNQATILQNENPHLYLKWLQCSMDKISDYPNDEQIVFINAWNEWGEGCHLEPDLKHGRMFLESTILAKNGLEYNDNLVNTQDIIETNNSVDKKRITIEPTRQIFIWGAGEYGKKVLRRLINNDINVSGFIDSDPLKEGRKVESYFINSPSILFSQSSIIKPYVIIASMYADEIEEVLKKNGYKKCIDYSRKYTIRKRLINKQMKYSIEQMTNIYCNICGYNQFTDIENQDNCLKCGSTSVERLVVKLLGDEFNQSGLPIYDWIKRKNINILMEGFGESIKSKLNEYFTIFNDRQELIDLGSVVDLAFITKNLEETSQWDEILDFEGKVFSISDLSDGPNSKVNFKNLSIILRDYPNNKIEKQKVIIYQRK